MTTITSQSAAPALHVPEGRPGIPFARLLRVEARKLVDTRAGRGLLIAIAAITLLAVGLQLYFADDDSLTYRSLLSSALAPQLFLIPVFGVLAVTSEVGQRTGMVTYCLEPRRWRVVAAKSLAAMGFSLLLLAVGALLAAGAHVLAIAVKDTPSAWSVPWGVAGGTVLTQLLIVLQGVAFGLFFRSTALAIVVFFVLPTAFTIVTGLVSKIATARPWIDFTTASLPLYDGSMTGRGWAHLATSGLLWIVAPLAIGTWLLTRREI